MSPRRFAISYAVCLTVLVASSGVLFAFTADLPRPPPVAYPSGPLELVGRVQFATIGLLGAFLMLRVPQNRFVWLLMVVGAGFPIWDAAETYGRWRLQGGQPWDGVAAAWVTSWAWAPTVTLAGPMFLLFPTGAPPSRRWWIVGGPALGAAGGLLLLGIVMPGPLDVFPEVDNPIGVPVSRAALEAVKFGLLLVQVIGLVAGVASVGVRLVRARGVERQQVKWIASAGVVLLAFNLTGLTGVLDLGTDGQRAVFEVATTVVIAVAIGAAITRHRLYEIDRIIGRTVAYVLIVAILAVVYLILVVGLSAGARALTGDSGDVVVALSTLVVAAAFQPVRRRVRLVVDRRFDRARYDAARTIDAFGRDLRDEVSRDAIVEELLAATSRTFRPRVAGVVLVGASAEAARP